MDKHVCESNKPYMNRLFGIDDDDVSTCINESQCFACMIGSPIDRLLMEKQILPFIGNCRL